MGRRRDLGVDRSPLDEAAPGVGQIARTGRDGTCVRGELRGPRRTTWPSSVGTCRGGETFGHHAPTNPESGTLPRGMGCCLGRKTTAAFVTRTRLPGKVLAKAITRGYYTGVGVGGPVGLGRSGCGGWGVDGMCSGHPKCCDHPAIAAMRPSSWAAESNKAAR